MPISSENQNGNQLWVKTQLRCATLFIVEKNQWCCACLPVWHTKHTLVVFSSWKRIRIPNWSSLLINSGPGAMTEQSTLVLELEPFQADPDISQWSSKIVIISPGGKTKQNTKNKKQKQTNTTNNESAGQLFRSFRLNERTQNKWALLIWFEFDFLFLGFICRRAQQKRREQWQRGLLCVDLSNEIHRLLRDRVIMQLAKMY